MTFHLIASLMTPGHFRSAWRLPDADPHAYLDIDYFRGLARIADEVGLDAIFLGDAPALGPEIATNPGTGIDPLILLGHLAAVTERVGVLVTSSTSYNSPYNLARRFQALDIVTKGRAAVNLVTTYAPAAAANFGQTEPAAKETRYRRAHEFLTVVRRLWDSWEPGAIVADKASGRYVDPGSIHAADHHGEFFSVAGPLPVPGDHPVVVQAGGSEGGLNLGAELADVVFTVAQTQAKAIAFRDDIRRRAVAAGRGADDVKISLGVIVLIGETEDDARTRADELYATLGLDQLARGVLAALGLGDRDLDEPIGIADLPEVPVAEAGSVGFQVSTRALLAERPLSARELARHAPGSGHRLVVGTAEQIADDLESWYRAGTADGFTIMYADTAVDFERFARLVVPLLIDRGLFRPAESGSTLRDRLDVPQYGQRRTGNAAVAG
ncbi:FMN-dependent oxidoreductase (nitrilotriacetate monooxygenase family) [Kribbella aluminosa]|uniref:FMN-dependent oxidoreductase (Nitrilotriacetate monooxygenase family) n=1 Tax=Kribbella aluminosa TaxID=416017 RepID=A0ABS4UK14_9ACTN|nr:NtaA/DmoA family FMN-dependent monooxygenase [Kribbella aluminosa]MBP2351881.1 FMN-dependent oxidoreductase (nitrilotriacetate monooxygenase family) [Kribbella aluminosa]